ncbi:hypothetical protein OG21DRAFT_274806 [Imleria badia]|nr:hypothetical protein OG21DRAFT_274806 [Imleria badia]
MRGKPAQFGYCTMLVDRVQSSTSMAYIGELDNLRSAVESNDESLSRMRRKMKRAVITAVNAHIGESFIKADMVDVDECPNTESLTLIVKPRPPYRDAITTRLHNTDMDLKLEARDQHISELEAELAGSRTEVAHVRSVNKSLHDELLRKNKLLMPLHLRVLLDLSRNKVVAILRKTSWKAVLEEAGSSDTGTYIINNLGNQPNNPLSTTIQFLCSWSNTRERGNRSAHQATQAEICDAVNGSGLNAFEKEHLSALYLFIFGISVDDDIQGSK